MSRFLRLNIDELNKKQERPIQIANESSHLEVVKFLIMNGASIVYYLDRDGGLGFLQKSLFRSEILDISLLLIERGADIYHVARYGNLVLNFSCKVGAIDIVSFILKNKNERRSVENLNKVNNAGECPLDSALDNGHKEIVIMLIEAGANVNGIGLIHENLSILQKIVVKEN